MSGHDCLVFFQAHDAVYQKILHPGLARNGTTEIGHVLGLHRVFDELRLRHPGLVVDVCAGGGRNECSFPRDGRDCVIGVIIWCGSCKLVLFRTFPNFFM